MSRPDSEGRRPRAPLTLSRDAEHHLARRWQEHGDLSARDLLVGSQLGTVRAVVRGYGFQSSATVAELIAEGNWGLLRAVNAFDPGRGTRLSTYAVCSIRACVSHYLLRSRSLVATGVQSKLLAKIRCERAGRAARLNESDAEAHLKIASRLALSSDALHSLVERMDVRDVPGTRMSRTQRMSGWRKCCRRFRLAPRMPCYSASNRSASRRLSHAPCRIWTNVSVLS